MRAVRTFETEERRARLGVRHHLAQRDGPVEVVASDLVGLHSSDPATVFLSARARVDGFDPAHLEDALYGRRSLVRVLGMRRTLFVVPTAFVGVIDAACTKALVPAQRRRLAGMLAEQVATDGRRGMARRRLDPHHGSAHDPRRSDRSRAHRRRP